MGPVVGVAGGSGVVGGEWKGARERGWRRRAPEGRGAGVGVGVGGGGAGGVQGVQMVIALVSGANRLDAEALARAAGRPDAKVKQAKPDRVRETTGFPVGGVPPFGHSRTLATFVDPDLLDHEVIWAAAGTPSTVFAISPTDLVKATAATSL